MKLIVFVFIVVTSFQLSKQNGRINYGASTSSGQTRELSFEECEIIGYADRIINLLFSEDANGADLREMMENHRQELRAFRDEIFSYITVTRFGAQYIADATRQRNRLRFFTSYMTMKILSMVNDDCTRHYRHSLVHNYDSESNMILVTGNVSYQPDTCLCENYRERSILSRPFSLPHNYLHQPDLALQLEVNINQVNTPEVSVYHVIPLSLITKFFNAWLSEEPTNETNSYFNLCIQTLLGRLRRSMQKLLIASFGRSPGDNVTFDTSNFFSETIELTHGMLSGNMFIGPTNRGPFSPAFHRHGDITTSHRARGGTHHRNPALRDFEGFVLQTT